MSRLEDELARQLEGAGLPTPVREMRFDDTRAWRFDFAWPAPMVALEVEGATWAGGRHTRGRGFEADCEKYNAAALAGWTVLRVTGAMVRDGRALAAAARAVG
jgi:hypothetical protein